MFLLIRLKRRNGGSLYNCFWNFAMVLRGFALKSTILLRA